MVVGVAERHVEHVAEHELAKLRLAIRRVRRERARQPLLGNRGAELSDPRERARVLHAEPIGRAVCDRTIETRNEEAVPLLCERSVRSHAEAQRDTMVRGLRFENEPVRRFGRALERHDPTRAGRVVGKHTSACQRP